MPLFERTRIEIFIPELALPAYQDILRAFQREFAFAFGGCSTLTGVQGHYVSISGQLIPDTINLVFVDIPYSLNSDRETLTIYCDYLEEVASLALEEETVLITASPCYHTG